MNKKYLAIAGSILLAFTACGTPPPVEVTRIVEVTRVSAAPAAAAPAAAAPVAVVIPGNGKTLADIKARGKVICGGNNAVPGFGFLAKDGSFAGLDVDFCRALAAAIFGDAGKIELKPTTGTNRFTVLQGGEVDVLIRNTTWTLSRDTDNGSDFVGINFYDGQGMTVPKAGNYKALTDLKDKTICVQKGTTTELNLADQMTQAKASYKPLVFETADEVWGAYEAERCDAITTDKSGLISRMSLLKKPADHVIMDVTMSKEPLGPMVRHGDNNWADIVRWVFIATVAAEEYGVTSKNADQLFAETKDAEIQRLLGKNGEMGKKLGLPNEWALNVVKLVGNYGEIYDRNLGPATATFIPRGLNNIYTKGGLHYAPPVR